MRHESPFRLLVHMTSHNSSQEEEMNQGRSEMGFESNSQSSMSSLSQQQSQEPNSLRNTVQNTSGEAAKSVSLLKQPSLLKQSLQGKTQKYQQSSSSSSIEKLRGDADSDDSLDSDEEQSNSNEPGDEQSYSCDLCDLFFKSAKELRQHVKSHIESFSSAQIEETNLEDDDQFEEDQEQDDHYENDMDEENGEEEIGEEEMVEEDFEDEVSERYLRANVSYLKIRIYSNPKYWIECIFLYFLICIPQIG